MRNKLKKYINPRSTSFVVLLNALLLIFYTLIIQITRHRSPMRNGLSSYSAEVNLIIGFSLLYLSSLLRRGKKNAWVASLIFYIAVFIYNFHRQFLSILRHHHWYAIALQIILPLVVIILLIVARKQYTAKSDARSFRSAVVYSLIFLILTFVYGVVGFTLLDQSNFHHEFTITDTIHYTIDQLGLTTSVNLEAYTKEGRIFLDSLNTATILSLVFIAYAFFSPLRFKLSDQNLDRERFEHLLEMDTNSNSEDFFKLWPRDKQYYFDSSGFAAIAYRVERGVALAIGGPTGESKYFNNLIKGFDDLCYGNDWKPCFFHTESAQIKLLNKHNFDLVKLGEEAVVHIDTFISSTSRKKYFRNIVNRFSKNGYTSEYLKPPHSKALISRLQTVSDEWLARDKDERGFAMGYFTEEYMNISDVLVARDEAGTIQAFINIVPAKWDSSEATYDLLRFSKTALGNINDFLLIELINKLATMNYQTLNLGLCPLAGLDQDDLKTKNVISRTMKLVYSNVDRFYSFSGLYKFKYKYQPVWRNRYIAYRGGIRGFTRSMNALLRTMKKTAKTGIIVSTTKNRY